MFKSFTKTRHTQPYPSILPSRPKLSVTGKVVFITSSSSRIRKATAIAFAQASTKAVAIFRRRVKNLQLAAKEVSKANLARTTTVVYKSVDISQSLDLEAAFARASNKAGGA
jgi:NAD(P)-dependent dehydrogenase (short-subunit alcohol dehydrogenase family)